MSQQQLADMLSVGRTAIANIEAGFANPGHKTLLELAGIFEVQIDDLLNRNLESDMPKALSKKPTVAKGPVVYRPVVVTVDEAGEENIVLVDTKAAAGYPTRYLEPEFYKELPAFKLPGSDYRNGTFRCFQVEGDSMVDSLQNGDFVVGRFCDNHFKDIREGYIHVVVTNDNVLVKRILNKAESEHKLTLISDNDAYPAFDVDIDEVKEIWYVKSKLTNYMPVKKHDIDKLIGDLTMQVHLLKSRLDGIERN
jgi:phage repressor protein C with HTH and peptisase S24 domain